MKAWTVLFELQKVLQEGMSTSGNPTHPCKRPVKVLLPKKRLLTMALGLAYLCNLMVPCEARCAACEEAKQGQPHGPCCAHDQSSLHTEASLFATQSSLTSGLIRCVLSR